MISLLKGFFCALWKVLTNIHKQSLFFYYLKKCSFRIHDVIFGHGVISVAICGEKQYFKIWKSCVNILVIPPASHAFRHCAFI